MQIEGNRRYTIEQLERLLDSMPFSTWIKDENNQYIYVNEVYANAVGDTKENVIGKNDSDYWPKEACDCCYKSDKEVRETRIPKIFEEVRGEGIHRRWFETYKAALFDEEDQFLYTVGTSREITLSKSLNERLYETNNGLSSIEKPEEETNEDQLIQMIEVDIFKWLDASETSIWLYDNSDSLLKIYAKTGRTEDYFISESYLQINKSDFNLDRENVLVEGILPIEQRDKYIDLKLLRKNGVSYLGIYKIEKNDELLGVLICTFRDDKNLKVNQDEIIKKICKKIANIIKVRMASHEIKDRLEKHKDTEKELNMFLETVVDLVAIIGKKGKFQKVCPRWTTLLGWSEEELLNMTWEEILHEDEIRELEYNKYHEMNGATIRGIKNRYKCKDGSYKWLEWNGRYIKEMNVVLIAGRDITEEVERERKNQALQKVLELEKIKNEFFANMSHEFKTPINIILGTVQLIETHMNIGEVTAEAQIDFKKYSKFIKQNSYRLLRLVNNLIDMTRIDAGQLKMQVDTYNIINVVEEITLSVAEYTKDKGVELLFDTEVEELMLTCDPDKIERIILNILSNAIKFSGENGKIEVYLQVVDQCLQIRISDNGIGIPQDQLPHIFERFVQVNNMLTRQAEGSGIGLSLVKSLVELHQGTIEVESIEDVGTSFTITFPIRVEQDREIAPLKERASRVEKCYIEFSDIYW